MTDGIDTRSLASSDDRGVSEVIGFVLVFSLVLGTISIVYVGGFSALSDTRDGEHVNNAERAMDVLADNFQQLGRGEAPQRGTEIKLADAQLTLDERYGVEVDVSGTSYSSRGRPITYHSGTGTRISYEHGAIIRVDDDGGAVMLREPDFLISDERTVIRHIQLRGGELNHGGSQTVLVRAGLNFRELQYPPAGGDSDVTAETLNVTIQTAPERTGAWLRYMEDQPQLTDCTERDVSGIETHREIECSLTTDSLAVSVTGVDVEFT